MVLFPPPFYFVFDISNLLSYIQNISSNELACPVMGTIFLVYFAIDSKSRSSVYSLCTCNSKQLLKRHSAIEGRKKV